MLIVRRIHAVYRLCVAPEKREDATRAHGIHADYCPVARTIRGCVEVTCWVSAVLDSSGSERLG